MTTPEQNKIDTAEYGRIYDAVESKAKGTVQYFLDNNDIAGEDTATIISSVIGNVIDRSLIALKSGYEFEAMTKDIAIKDVNLQVAAATKDFKISSANLDTQLKTKKLATQDLVDLKMTSEKLYIDTQKTELSASVIYNNKIKTLDSLSDLWGTLGAGGLVVPAAGWTTVFEIAKDLASTTMPIVTDFQAGVTRVPVV